jgi:hypothetical protein
MKDYLSRSHTIWCAWCSDWETFQERTEAGTVKAAKKHGWVIKGKWVAVCRDCNERGGGPDWTKGIREEA